MTKARGAFDSIGKAGRGASFLLPAFSPYYAPYFPLFLCTYVQHCTQMHTSTHVRVLYMCNILCPEKHTFTRVLLFFFFLRSLRPSRFIPSFSICYIYSYLFLFPYVLNTFDVCMALSVRLSASSLFYHLNYYTRFHVMWLYAFAVRGQLYTWVNGKMSFETFLGRSRSPHCQSYTRDSAWGS